MAAIRTAPLRVAIVNDHEVVVRGLYALLQDAPRRMTVVELDSQLPVVQPVDLVLYDTFTMEGLDSRDVADLLASPMVGAVVIYTWAIDADLVALARERGVRAVIAKSLTGPELLDALEQAMSGDFFVHPEQECGTTAYTTGDWPGREAGLTAREAEVVALITLGLSNLAIAERTHLSINSVKTYIRTAYRTMGVTTRSQAVLWGIEHGLTPRPRRIVLEPAARESSG